jgi:hypothetical protein
MQSQCLKKTVATILMLCIHAPMFAQVLIALLFGEKLQSEKLTFGLSFIPTYSTISNIEGAKFKNGFGVGLYFDIKITKNFFIHPEAIPKSSLGTTGLPPYPTGIDSLDSFFSNGSISRKIKAISVPLLCRYRIKGLLFAEAGPQIDWMLNVKDTYRVDVNGDDVTYTTELKNQYNRFDLGLAAGLHCKLKKDKGIGLGVRYFYGLTDIDSNIGSQTNQAFYINILIPVGAGKAAEENAAAQ